MDKPVLHVGRPNIGNRESFLARVNDILDRRWLSNNGPVVQEFEKRVAEFWESSMRSLRVTPRQPLKSPAVLLASRAR